MTALAAQGEAERIEFKRSTGQLTEGVRSVCAMLNGVGGFVFFGVRDNGELIGQDVADRTLQEVAQETRRLEPPAFPDLETVALNSGKTVRVIRVSGSRPGPYRYDGRPYIRHASTTILMSQDE
ncbi:MAG: ATP-binding protein [Planctomycetes bacterium]|nr:ATP-binding protein [Planctomycetota bacterium]